MLSVFFVSRILKFIDTFHNILFEILQVNFNHKNFWIIFFE
jgi:hypothetical protein